MSHLSCGLAAPGHAAPFQIGHDELEHIIGELRGDHPAGSVDGRVHVRSILEHRDSIITQRERQHRHEGARASRVHAFDI